MSRRWLSAAAALFLACVFLHQPVTDFCDYLARRFGFLEYNHGVAVGFEIAAGLAVVALAFGRGRSATTWIAMAALGALVFAAEKILILNSVENVHFPQYAAVVVLLSQAGLSLDSSWLAATLLGIADEEYQYLFLRAGRPDPLDWNDINLNAIGAAIGVLLLVHFAIARAERPRFSWRLILAVMTPLVLGALWIAPPVFSPFYKVVASGFQVHILTPGEGMAIATAIWIGVGAALRRLSAHRQR